MQQPILMDTASRETTANVEQRCGGINISNLAMKYSHLVMVILIVLIYVLMLGRMSLQSLEDPNGFDCLSLARLKLRVPAQVSRSASAV